MSEQDKSAETTSHYETAQTDKHPKPCRAQITRIEPDSPAYDAGLEPGMVLTQVNGMPLRDIIEWRWQTDDLEVSVMLDDGQEALLIRDPGEDWGITFADTIFDGIMTCRNACTFCFMTMLPPDMRPTLYLRDDDYRLSFLQGNFVTLTNLSDEEVERVIEYGLSPLHVSLHAVTPEVRESLMGRNASRGFEVLERLLVAGIDVHVQVVVVPGVNDGSELTRTLSWIESQPHVLSAGFVPLGYTKYQDKFSSSFSDDPDAAAEVIELIREFQEDSGVERRNARLQIADEFYLNAGFSVPPSFAYGDFPQFEDGIGMIRSFLDEWKEAADLQDKAAEALEGKPPAVIVCGTAFAKVMESVLEDSPLFGKLEVLPVENSFFGGNVDVTGLITGQDLIPALKQHSGTGVVLLHSCMFNPDMRLLDDVSLDEVKAASSGEVVLTAFTPKEILSALAPRRE